MKARSKVSIIIGVACAVALSVWEGSLSRQSTAARWSVAVIIGAFVTTAFILGRSRQELPSGAWWRQSWRAVANWRDASVTLVIGVVIWILLIASVVGWDLNSFFHQEHDLPTLSRIIGVLTSRSWGRALVFVTWLGSGLFLGAGRRREVAE